MIKNIPADMIDSVGPFSGNIITEEMSLPEAIETIETTVDGFLNLQMTFRTLATAAASLVLPSVNRINLLFFDDNEVEGSGAYYRRVTTEPTHPGKLQTIGGQWWEIGNEILCPEMRGAIGNGDESNMTADTYGMQDILDISAATLREIRAKVATYVIDTYKGARPAWTNGGRWTHGGLVFPAGAKFVGAGRGRTIIKNGSDVGRCLARWQKSGLHHIEACTFDYDFPNKDTVPYASPATATTGSGGTGILFEGGSTAIMDITILDVEIKNTFGYGLGIENVTVSSALIDGLYIDKPGADAIDIKSYLPEVSGGVKVGVMTNIFIPNGCGHNFIAAGEEGGHNDQACIDIGGAWHVSNVHIDNLNSDPASTGNTGIRFRSATILPDGREGAPRSTLTGFTIRSSKTQGVGSDTDNCIIGLGIYSPNVSISNGYIEGCYRNIFIGSYGAADNPDPYDVNMSNITLVNANGANAAGSNLKVAASIRDITALGIKIRGGDIGIDLDGSGGALELNIENCTLGVKALKNIWRNYNWLGLRLENNTVDSDTLPNVVGGAIVTNKKFSIISDRQAWSDHHALADDTSWSGENAWAGGRRLYAYDSSGTVGEIWRDGWIATGSAGAAFRYQIRSYGTTMIQIQNNAMGFFGSIGTTKPTVSGSKSNSEAMTSLLTALANLGLITDSTTT